MHCNRFAKFTLLSMFLMVVLVSLSVADNPPIASLTADVQNGDIPLLVNFADTSTGEITYRVWDFGDGSDLLYTYESGVVQHTFTSYNTFNVSLTVYEDEFTYSSTSTQVVTYAPLVACFTMNYLPGSLPMVVDFTDVSEGNPVTWAWDFGDECTSNVQNPTHTYTEAGEYIVRLSVTNLYSDTSEADSDMPVPEVWQTDANGTIHGGSGETAWSISLKSVGFKSDETGPEKWHIIHRDKDSQDAYTEDPFSDIDGKNDLPQWEDNSTPLNGTAEDDGDHKYPICHTSGSHMKVKLITHATGNPPDITGWRGYELDSSGKKISSGYHFPATEPASPIIPCGKAFPSDTIQYFSELTIMWEVKVGGKWGKLAPSKNQCYVTLVDPVTAQTNKLFHTCLHVACEKAKGLGEESAIIAKIWENFSGRTIMRAEDLYVRPFATDPKALKYYDPWSTSSLQTQTLLSSGNGQCRAWGKFFADVLKVNGFHESGEQNLLTLKPVGYTGMLIKNWDFASSPHYADVVAGYPYANINWKGDEGSKTSEMKHTWELMDVTDNTSGIPGQGPNSNPSSFFGNHVIVKYKNKYYDPSYGSPISSDIDTLETNSVAGYVMLSVVTVNEANIYDPSIQPPNPQTGYDVNHNGQIDSPTCPICGIKQNPSGNQLQATDNEEY